ncbi:hypothetical protein [Embleya sp. NPDC020630]|uniref:hypothetical protein n=1 Tax=Embleya sp. NPDC020630 TaxID=3363979 RepID=UPI0037BD88BB
MNHRRPHHSTQETDPAPASTPRTASGLRGPILSGTASGIARAVLDWIIGRITDTR